jgi:hypothetical protein
VIAHTVHGRTALVEIGDPLGVDVRNGLADQMGFQQRTDLEDLLDAILADALDESPVMRRRGDPAFRLQCGSPRARNG